MTTTEFPAWLLPRHPEYHDAGQAAWDIPLATDEPLLREARLRALDAPGFFTRFARLEASVSEKLCATLRAKGANTPDVLADKAIWVTLIRMEQRGGEPVRDPYAYALTAAMKLHAAYAKAMKELRGQARALVPAAVLTRSGNEGIGEFISTLPPRQQQVALLISKGQSYAGIAVILGIKASTVRVHITRIREHFRQWEERGGQG